MKPCLNISLKAVLCFPSSAESLGGGEMKNFMIEIIETIMLCFVAGQMVIIAFFMGLIGGHYIGWW